ncbi:hypothetical protein PHYBOEH_003417 [Phytophthora boehmeriae]|uniref:Uncharacterized protein n=1 Tax=Phytophthora boehmeriae TaxID=109152 RepID=A0A8T1WNX3_9STRA|nr:hypothetical protein PHYBOEH_003417 [Phytophthora boehmeriae]
MPATAQARESKITFCNEQWTAESARLLLELDEGWVGFHNAEQWQWSDATYDLFVLECRERRWPCNSRDSCVAMLHALRSGAISMKISNALRSPQGFVQWHPHEMRALGLQMSRLTIGKTRVTSWYKQLVLFIDRMHGKDPDYRFGVEGRTIEHFKQRARRYLADSIVKEIEGCDDIESDSSAQSSAVEQQVEKSSRSMREKSSAVVKKSAVKTNAASSVAGEAKKSKEKTVSSAQIAVNAPVQFSLRRSVSLSVDSVEKTSERKSVSFQEIGVETNKTSTGFREVSMSNECGK